jgi:hypothetical protein
MALSQVPGNAKLLMNHAIPGVNAGYLTRHKLLEGHLRSQQSAVLCLLRGGRSISQDRALQDWLGRGACRRTIQGVIPKWQGGGGPTSCSDCARIILKFGALDNSARGDAHESVQSIMGQFELVRAKPSLGINVVELGGGDEGVDRRRSFFCLRRQPEARARQHCSTCKAVRHQGSGSMRPSG